ncbi:MAG: hypothetical protein WD049_04680 [Candidatus Paceibacterota bacterium]
MSEKTVPCQEKHTEIVVTAKQLRKLRELGLRARVGLSFSNVHRPKSLQAGDTVRFVAKGTDDQSSATARVCLSSPTDDPGIHILVIEPVG